MTDELIRQLIDFGGLGGFAAFLVWQFLQMQRRLDSLVDKFQEQVNSLSDNFDTRIEKIRIRYDKVISDIREECSNEKKYLQNELKEVQRDLLTRERESVLKLELEQDK